MNPQTNITTSGVSKTVFTGLSPGITILTVNVDSQTLTTNIKINTIPSLITVNPASGYKGGNIKLTAKLTDSENNPLINKTIQFSVMNNIIGTANTDENGIAELSYNITQAIGKYSISAEFIGDNIYADSGNNNNLTVVKTPTNIIVNPVKGNNGKYMNLTATLQDSLGNLLTSQSVIFNISGKQYKTVTNNMGMATVKYLPNGVGKYILIVDYNGNNNYTKSQGKGLLTIDPAAYLYLKILSSKSLIKIGELFTITYKLENLGPNNAKNVVVTIPLPNGFQISDSNENSNLRNSIGSITLISTVANVPLGDSYFYIKGKITNIGHYSFDSKEYQTPTTLIPNSDSYFNSTIKSILVDPSTNIPNDKNSINSKQKQIQKQI